MQTIHIEISSKTILKTLFLLGLLWLLLLLKDIVVIVFLAYILMSAFSPLIDHLEVKGLPRWLTAALVIVLLLVLVALSVASLVPPFVEQTKQFILNLPILIGQAFASVPLLKDIFPVTQEDLFAMAQSLAGQFSRELLATPVGVVKLGASFLQRLFALVTFIFVSFYLLVEHRKVERGAMFFLPAERRKEYHRLMCDVEKKLGGWLRGELVLMFIIGLTTYLTLGFIGLPFALPLAVLAGILEIVPIIGPIISVIPAIFVAASLSPVYVLTVIILYTIIQQLESNFIVPAVMKQAVGLDPLVVLLALMVGTRLLGPMGALLSVPATAVLTTLASELFSKK